MGQVDVKDQISENHWLVGFFKEIKISASKPLTMSGLKSFWRGIVAMAALVAVLALFTTASAQSITKNDLVKLTASVDTFRSNYPIEKLYIQFDKPYYAIGDTIWLKAYLFSAAYLDASKKSGLFYLELTNDSNKVVKRLMLPVSDGLSWGNIELNAKEIPQGNYTLKAYTNWMRNFSEDYIFKKSFYFADASANNWLVTTSTSMLKDNAADKAHLNLQFYQLDKEPVILKDMELSVLAGKKIWYKNKVQTGLDGVINIDFIPKIPLKKLMLIAEETVKTGEKHKLIIPIVLNRPENMDLQFMPEGGNLVAGLPAYIGFKAIGEDGRGTDVAGVIFNSHQQQVAMFNSAYKGMGAFNLLPQTGESYSAKVMIPGNIVKTYTLPTVKAAGTVLKIRDIKDVDSLAITITGTEQKDSYYLVGQSRGVVCYGAVVNLVNNVVRDKISTMAFPTGIARFTLLNAARQPINERIIFIDHHDNLQISIKPDKPFYTNRDSIALHIQVTNANGIPVKGDFSLSVIDDAQVKMDSMGHSNIVTNLLLTSDLKGEIEEPGYYLKPDADGSIKQHLDYLLLSQGWVGYDWKDIFNIAKLPRYNAEHEFVLKGRVTNVFNKSKANTPIIVFSKKPFVLIDTVTDNEGRFFFKNIMPLDTPVFLVQARNKRGRSFNVNVEVDEFKPPLFPLPTNDIIPWYVNSDSVVRNYIKGSIAIKNQHGQFPATGHVLKEVVIKSKKIIKGSQNLNGPGNADVVIDEQELEKADKKTFLQLLQEKVKGFREGILLLQGAGERAKKDALIYAFIRDTDMFPGQEPAQFVGNEYWYYINDKPVKFIIDGTSMYTVLTPDKPIFTDITNYLKSHSAEDIKGIEVNISAKYTSKYVPMNWAALISPADMAFVEITTRGGSGPGISNTPGTYVYKPLPFSVPRQFYSPRYTLTNRHNPEKDLRSTLYWNPNVVTDEDGKAMVSFYSADITGTYTATVEGTDWNGSIGSKSKKIDIKDK